MISKKRIVIALGGNAIDSGNQTPTAAHQKAHCEIAAEAIFSLIKEGHEVIVTHGNGPQVGALLLQNESCHTEKTPAMPLDTLVAQTQGMIGFWLQNALYNLLQKNGLQKNIVTFVTQVVVKKEDPAFQNPSKFIGAFYSEKEAMELQQTKSYQMKEDSHRGYRRVVPSPKPVDILEKNIIQQNLDLGNVILAGGGGGIPVVDEKGSYHGVEAVIDKDLTSAQLATLVKADYLLILTAVNNVCINFGKPEEKNLYQATIQELDLLIQENQFPAGSMLPKIQAAKQFVVANPNKTAIITSLEQASKIFMDNIGTKIIS